MNWNRIIPLYKWGPSFPRKYEHNNNWTKWKIRLENDQIYTGLLYIINYFDDYAEIFKWLKYSENRKKMMMKRKMNDKSLLYEVKFDHQNAI